MEESEKRRERLRALRLQAAAAAAASSSETLTHNNHQQQQQLGNPLIDYEQPQPPAAASRFDYYTDPLSAYSSHKHPLPQTLTPPLSGSGSGSGSTYFAPNHHHHHHHPPPGLHAPYQPRLPNYGPSPPPFRLPLPQGTPSTPPYSQLRPARPRSDAPRMGPASTYSHAHSHSHRSMLEDPWKFLEPTLWHSDPTFPNTWGSPKLTSVTHLHQGITSTAKLNPGSVAHLNQDSRGITSTAKLNRGPLTMSYGAKKARVITPDKSSTKTNLAKFLAEAAAAAEAEGDGDQSGTV